MGGNYKCRRFHGARILGGLWMSLIANAGGVGCSPTQPDASPMPATGRDAGSEATTPDVPSSQSTLPDVVEADAGSQSADPDVQSGSAGADATASSAQTEGDFYELLRETVIDFPVAQSYDEQAARSEIVLLGTYSAVSMGRSFLEPPDSPWSLRTAVLEVRVDEVFKGEPADSVHVEYVIAGSVTAQDLMAAMPTHRFILFLSDITELEQFWDVFEDGKGRPAGSRLYEMVTPQGLVVEMPDGGAAQPLLNDAGQSLPGPSSFEEAMSLVGQM